MGSSNNLCAAYPEENNVLSSVAVQRQEVIGDRAAVGGTNWSLLHETLSERGD